MKILVVSDTHGYAERIALVGGEALCHFISAFYGGTVSVCLAVITIQEKPVLVTYCQSIHRYLHCLFTFLYQNQEKELMLMSKTETVMWCLAYALGRRPRQSEIRQAKRELLDIDHNCTDKVIKSINYMLPYMSEHEISRFREQICTCMLGAVNYRVSMQVKEFNAHGYYICPRCQTPLDRDYQAYCSCCGQHLGW